MAVTKKMRPTPYVPVVNVVLTYAGAEYPDVEITSLAVAVKNDSKSTNPASPCRSCRQIIANYQSKQKAKIKIYLVAEGDEIYAIDSSP
ncbi:MAG: hypothetical protein R2766_05195 [Saprospiraceae bacterium]